MSSGGIGFEKHQEIIDQWAKTYSISEFVAQDDVSAKTLYRLRKLDENGLVWHMITTNDAGWILEPGFGWYGRCLFCEALEHLNADCKGSRGMGWSTTGFFIADNPAGSARAIEIEYQLPCAACNEDSDFESPDPDCSSCEGEGDLYVEYQWPAKTAI